MNLEFSLPEIAAVALAVWIVAEISGDGECNWLEGVQLLSVYLIIAFSSSFCRSLHMCKTESPARPAGARSANPTQSQVSPKPRHESD